MSESPLEMNESPVQTQVNDFLNRNYFPDSTNDRDVRQNPLMTFTGALYDTNSGDAVLVLQITGEEGPRRIRMPAQILRLAGSEGIASKARALFNLHARKEKQ